MREHEGFLDCSKFPFFIYLSAGNKHVEFVKIHQILLFFYVHFCMYEYVIYQYNLEKEG